VSSILSNLKQNNLHNRLANMAIPILYHVPMFCPVKW